MLILAAFSRYEEALDWTVERVTATWGAIALTSERFEHNETAFYHKTMGTGLRKQFFGFAKGFDPAELADRKLQAIAWEADYAAMAGKPEPRPLNLDPGYLTEAKLVLASTKDRDFRIYLRDGIFAEVTLHWQHGKWQPREWIYPDYARADYHKFFEECRRHVREHWPLKPRVLKSGGGSVSPGE